MATINSSVPAIKQTKLAQSTGIVKVMITPNDSTVISGFNPKNVTEGTFKKGDKPSDALGIWGRRTGK